MKRAGVSSLKIVETLLNIDWRSMFVPTGSLLEVVLRGSIMYLGMFALLRVFRRQAGAVGMADLLVIVVIADADQNGMAGESRSITEALVLVAVIVAWDWMFDWLGYRSQLAARVLEPQPLELIRNGRIIKENLEQEMITEDELMSNYGSKASSTFRALNGAALRATANSAS